MLNVSDLARRLTGAVTRGSSSSTRSAQVTEAEVVWAMGARDDETLSRFKTTHGPQAILAIDASLTSLPRILADEHLMRRRPGYVRYFEVLPRIIFLWGRGHSSDEIAGVMTFMATGIGVDNVLRMTAEVIARRINRSS